MGMSKVKALKYTCDDCGSVQIVEDEMDVIGYNGNVFHRYETGGNGGDWFACREACIRNAITNALKGE